MEIVLNKDELSGMFKAVAELAVLAYRSEQKPSADRLTQKAAYREFGEGRIKRWLKEGKIHRTRNGACENSPVEYSLLELKTTYNSELFQILN